MAVGENGEDEAIKVVDVCKVNFVSIGVNE